VSFPNRRTSFILAPQRAQRRTSFLFACVWPSFSTITGLRRRWWKTGSVVLGPRPKRSNHSSTLFFPFVSCYRDCTELSTRFRIVVSVNNTSAAPQSADELIPEPKFQGWPLDVEAIEDSNERAIVGSFTFILCENVIDNQPYWRASNFPNRLRTKYVIHWCYRQIERVPAFSP
jgi:hypothetical protein